MKPIAYYSYATALCTAFCCHASPLYGPLETGMQESQLLSSLKSCKSLEGPGTDAYLSRTGLNGAFKTKKPIGGLYFSLHFDYDKEGALRSVSFYSNSKVSKDEYDTRLKSLYKRMLERTTGLYGPPLNMPDWIEKDSLPGGSGHVHAHVAHPAGLFPDVRPGKRGSLRLHAHLPLFPALRHAAQIQKGPGQAEIRMGSHSRNSTNSRKPRDSSPMPSSPCPTKSIRKPCSISRKLPTSAVPNGYWGLAHLYRLGTDGVEKNTQLAEEYTRKAALAGFARAAMKYGNTWEKACKALDFNEAEATEWINRNKRAARAGYASEQYNMGIMYQHGFGVERNLDTAREWLQKAADQGHVQAQAALKKLPEAPAGEPLLI